jgi:hypothetical protein
MYGHRKGWKKRLRVGVENKSTKQLVKESDEAAREYDAMIERHSAKKEAK